MFPVSYSRSIDGSSADGPNKGDADANAGAFSTTLATNKWLLAKYEPDASLYTFSSCICLADLFGDGEFKLVIADLGSGTANMKLKVYRGTAMQSEHAIVDLPAGIVAFHMDNNDPHIPALAVASGSYLYIYKNLKPFYKFSLPPLAVNQAENDAWSQAAEERIDLLALKDILLQLRTELGETALTARSQAFLAIDDNDALEVFYHCYRAQPLKRQTAVTCMTTMKKTISDEQAVSCIVIGTENKDIFVLEPEAFTILSSVSLFSFFVKKKASKHFSLTAKLCFSPLLRFLFFFQLFSSKFTKSSCGARE